MQSSWQRAAAQAQEVMKWTAFQKFLHFCQGRGQTKRVKPHNSQPCPESQKTFSIQNKVRCVGNRAQAGCNSIFSFLIFQERQMGLTSEMEFLLSHLPGCPTQGPGLRKPRATSPVLDSEGSRCTNSADTSREAHAQVLRKALDPQCVSPTLIPKLLE